MNRTRNRIRLGLLLVLLLLALLPGQETSPAAATGGGVLRLHILANSDSEADQAVKLRVRDALLPVFEAAESYDDARAFVLSRGTELLAVCQSALSAAGAPVGRKAEGLLHQPGQALCKGRAARDDADLPAGELITEEQHAVGLRHRAAGAVQRDAAKLALPHRMRRRPFEEQKLDWADVDKVIDE